MSASEGTGARLTLALGLALVLIARPLPALAQDLGTALGGTADNLMAVVPVLTGLAYVLGAWFGLTGVLKLKDHVDAPQHVPMSRGVSRLAAGGALLALPYVLTVLVNTFNPGGALQIGGAGEHGLAKGAGSGLDSMFINLIVAIDGPMRDTLSVVCYVVGIIFAINGVIRLTKSSQDGPRGPSGSGTIMTFFTAAVLLSISQMMDVLTASVFGDSAPQRYATLAYDFGGDAEVAKQAESTMKAMFAFIQLVGWIGFVRGWLMLRAAAEGSQSASIGGAISQIGAGVVAVNVVPALNLLQTTMGISLIK